MEAPAIVKDPKIFWLFWGSVAAIWQVVSLRKHNGATGSETTRAFLRVDTKPGRYAFLVLVHLFVIWFPEHILNPVLDGISASSGMKVEDDDD